MSESSSVYRFDDETAPSQTADLHKLQRELVELGLTPNEAKVHIFLSKHGYRRAIEIAKSLHIPRTETYELLSSLQNKGLVIATFQHPIKFNAVPFEKGLETLINLQRERLKTFESKERHLLQLWKLLPESSKFYDDSEQEKFLILEGQFQVYSKAKDMRARAKREILVLGYEKDYVKLYHHDFMDGLDVLIEGGIIVKFIAHSSSNELDVFREIRKELIRRIPEDVSSTICFVVVDQTELLFFVNKGDTNNKDTLAMWTSSKPFVDAMKLLFSHLWDYSLPFEYTKKI